MISLKLTQKFAKQLLNGKAKKYLKRNKSGTFFVGAINFTFSSVDQNTKQIEITLSPKGSTERLFSVSEVFALHEHDVFTFEPVSLQLNISDI